MSLVPRLLLLVFSGEEPGYEARKNHKGYSESQMLRWSTIGQQKSGLTKTKFTEERVMVTVRGPLLSSNSAAWLTLLALVSVAKQGGVQPPTRSKRALYMRLPCMIVTPRVRLVPELP